MRDKEADRERHTERGRVRKRGRETKEQTQTEMRLQKKQLAGIHSHRKAMTVVKYITELLTHRI